MIKVFIIDDHAVVRMGLKATLPLEGDIVVVGEASTGDGAAAKVLAAKPDVTLLDIRLPFKDGLEVLSEILLVCPDAKVVMLTTSEADNHVYEALNRGAKGYVVKDRDADDILLAVRTVTQGGRFIPKAVCELYDHRQMTGGLSQQELEVLKDMAKGLKSAEIGARLGISIDGVKYHVRNIVGKLGVADRAAAVAEAIRRGFL